jgi:hypothetical protein
VTSPRSRTLQVLTDDSGNIRGAFLPTYEEQEGGPPPIRMTPGEGDVLHEIGVGEDAVDSLLATKLEVCRIDANGGEVRLVRRDSGEVVL